MDAEFDILRPSGKHPTFRTGHRCKVEEDCERREYSGEDDNVLQPPLKVGGFHLLEGRCSVSVDDSRSCLCDGYSCTRYEPYLLVV